MSSESKPYKGNKRDQYTIVLEDLRSDFRAFGDALQFTNKNVIELRDELKEEMSHMRHEIRSEISRLDTKIERVDRKLDDNLVELRKITRKHEKQLDDHEERISDLESH